MNKNSAWRDFIPDDPINQAIAAWHEQNPDRIQTSASPSTLTDCPRVVWLRKHKVPTTNPMGWGKLQRLLLGRNFENKIAEQLDKGGMLIHHWKDDVAGESDKFEWEQGESFFSGVPDLFLAYNHDNREYYPVSDAKTSRADSFAYVPIESPDIWDDAGWYKYKLQVTAYFMLCLKNKAWFEERGYPVPDSCHLFSFALDDGVVKRSILWIPTKEDMREVLALAKRWNAAYASETMPECTCDEHDGFAKKFCRYATDFTVTRTGYKLGKECCGANLGEGL